MRPIYIFDLDGTLALCEHRLHYIQKTPKDWRAFFAACVDDKPCHPVIRVARLLRKGGADVQIWTARSDEVREQTQDWICMHNVPYSVLKMRSAGDHRNDDELKAEWLESLVGTPLFSRIAGVFENRKRVVDMWRARGIPCYQVADGDF